jgi:hypothetical protein
MIPGIPLIGMAIGTSLIATTALVVSAPAANAGYTNCSNTFNGFSCSGSDGYTNCSNTFNGYSCSGSNGYTNCSNTFNGTSCSGTNGYTNCSNTFNGTSCSGTNGYTNCSNTFNGTSCSGSGSGIIIPRPTPTPAYKNYYVDPTPAPTYRTYPTPALTPSYSSGAKTNKEMVDEFQALLDKVNSDTEELNDELNSIVRLTCKKGSKTKYVIDVDPKCPTGYKQIRKSVI